MHSKYSVTCFFSPMIYYFDKSFSAGEAVFRREMRDFIWRTFSSTDCLALVLSNSFHNQIMKHEYYTHHKWFYKKKLRGGEKAEGTVDTSTWSWWEIKRFWLKLVFQKKKLMCYWSNIGDPTIQNQKLYSSKTKKRNSENIIFQVVTPHFAWNYSLFCLLIISTKKYKFYSCFLQEK